MLLIEPVVLYFKPLRQILHSETEEYIKSANEEFDNEVDKYIN